MTEPPSGPVEVVVEVPRGGFIKRAADGSIDFVSPLPSPFNYGSVPSVASADGEPLDAVILGPRLPVGDTRSWRVFGVVRFVDEDLRDDKLVCGTHPPTHKELARIRRFFVAYAAAKAIWSRLRGRGRVEFEGWQAYL